MHNLKQIDETKKHYSYILVFLFLYLLPQYSFPLDEPALTSSSEQIVADSVFNACSDRDSVIQNYFSKLDLNHKSRPVHPYFRDSYRIILDMRKLVRMFDYRAINGYESMNDLVDICRKLPEHKQAEMICTAMAGSVVNLVSERTNKELRKRKIHFLQWKLEKVFYQNKFKFLYMNFHTGMNSKGIGFSVPVLRIHYYRYYTSHYLTEGFIIMPRRNIGINCYRINGGTNITPFYSSKLGTIALTYDTKNRIVSSCIDLRKSSSFVIRIAHINFIDRRFSDRLLSEVSFCW